MDSLNPAIVENSMSLQNFTAGQMCIIYLEMIHFSKGSYKDWYLCMDKVAKHDDSCALTCLIRDTKENLFFLKEKTVMM